MRVLGIETSCDETGIAVYDDQTGLLANQLYSQVKLHADYGGVVPELASRDHVRKTVPLIQAALKEANLTPADIDGVDCTLVRSFPDRRSSFSSVFVDAEGERQIVNYRDTSLSMDAAWLADALPSRFDAALADTRWPDGAAALMAAARKRGVPAVIDAEAPVHEAAAALDLASHVAFSAQGLRDFTALDDLGEGLAEAARRLKTFVCVTDGPAGVLWNDGAETGYVPAFRIEAVDTLGAGDIWHGAFALRLGEGAHPAEAIDFANAAAAIKCTRRNGRIGFPDRKETEAFMKENPKWQ